jgi:hypothetical protein
LPVFLTEGLTQAGASALKFALDFSGHFAVHRVITRYRNGTGRPIIERGPWHQSIDTARDWQALLREMGYFADVESQHVDSHDNDDLANALSSMA